MYRPIQNTSKPYSSQPFDPSPPRSNRFSHEPNSHHDHSYSRSRSIEFSPTSIKKSSSSNQQPSDPRDPRLRLKRDPRSPPKTQADHHRHHIDYAIKKFEEPKDQNSKKISNKKTITIFVKMEEDDYQKKPELLEGKIANQDTDINQEADNVSTNSSEKSTLQADSKIELSESHVEKTRDPRKDPRRDPRLLKKEQKTLPSPAVVCSSHIVRRMEADIEALFDDEKEEEEDEEPAMILPKKNDVVLKPGQEIIDLEDDEDKPNVSSIIDLKVKIEEEEDDEVMEISDPKISLEESSGRTDPRKRLQKVIKVNQKLNLVLDLDETVINSHTVSQDFDLKQIKNIPQDHLSVMNNGELKTIIVVRPYTKEFLERVSKHYNIYVYSHGRYDYVQHILEILDKDHQYINREKIFKNSGQVGRATCKRLSNLGLSQNEINKTIILDDQRHIWEHDHLQVICSKKFIPLKDFIQEEKYSKYLLFKGKQHHDQQHYHDKNWLSSQENQSELEFYCETHHQRLGQLELLASFFEAIAKDYERSSSNSPHIKVQELCEARMKTILKGSKIAISTTCQARKKMFEEVAGMLGANVTDSEKAHYLVVDNNVEETQKAWIKKLVEEKPMITVVSIAWLMECFFRLTKAPINNFIEKL